MASRAFALSLVVLLVGACAGSHRAPMMQMPLFTRRGQTEAGLMVRPASPRAEVGGVVRVAATEHLRLGASVSGATRRSDDERLYDGARLRLSSSLYTEGFVGAEWSGLLFRYGALVGSGYGSTQYAARTCSAQGLASGCVPVASEARAFRYVRSYGQLHVALAPPGPLLVGLAVRVPFVVDLSRGTSAESDVGPELGLLHALAFRHLRLDLQPTWSRAQGFAFHLALLLRFQPSRR